MLTVEDINPEAKDLLKAQELIDGGWRSTSNKYRHVARFKKPIKAEEMIREDLLNTAEARYLIKIWNSRVIHSSLLRSPEEGIEIEQITLTIKEFKAFKQLGGYFA